MKKYFDRFKIETYNDEDELKPYWYWQVVLFRYKIQQTYYNVKAKMLAYINKL